MAGTERLTSTAAQLLLPASTANTIMLNTKLLRRADVRVRPASEVHHCIEKQHNDIYNIVIKLSEQIAVLREVRDMVAWHSQARPKVAAVLTAVKRVLQDASTFSASMVRIATFLRVIWLQQYACRQCGSITELEASRLASRVNDDLTQLHDMANMISAEVTWAISLRNINSMQAGEISDATIHAFTDPVTLKQHQRNTTLGKAAKLLRKHWLGIGILGAIVGAAVGGYWYRYDRHLKYCICFRTPAWASSSRTGRVSHDSASQCDELSSDKQ